MTQTELNSTASLMGKWKRYSAYKDSGVEWLGVIPEHWELWKVTHAFGLIGSGTTPLTSHEEYYDGDIPWVNTSELRDNLINNTSKKLTERALVDIPTLHVYPIGT
jgi:type I restriction enzyme, S subunit